MILHKGERAYWGAPEVIYLEGTIRGFGEKAQTVLVHVERATPRSAHLIGSELAFAADGLRPLTEKSPPGTTGERSTERQPPPELSNDEKVRRAAAVAVHQQYGYTLPTRQEEEMIAQVSYPYAFKNAPLGAGASRSFECKQISEVLNSDEELRAHYYLDGRDLTTRVLTGRRLTETLIMP